MPNKILVSGHVCIETTLAIKKFPIEYHPVSYPFFGIDTTVSGVGFNIAKALTMLGNNATILTVTGNDAESRQVEDAFKDINLHDIRLHKILRQTCQSVILYDQQGQRQIHTDLKDMQDVNVPEDDFNDAVQAHDIVILGNTNFNRPHIASTKAANKLIAVDLHVLADIHDEYNQDFIQAADILFLSDEACRGNQHDFLTALAQHCTAKIIVMGLGEHGALMYLRESNAVEQCPAYQTRDVVNTVGAGDALFSAFIHSYLIHNNPYRAIQTACIFASYKIGAKGAADGFLTHDGLEHILLNKEYSERSA